MARRPVVVGMRTKTASIRIPSIHRDGYALFLTASLLMMMVMPLELGIVSSMAIRLRWGILGLMALVGFGVACTHRGMRLLPTHYALLAFVVVSAMSCALSIMPSYSAQRWVSLILLILAVIIGPWSWLCTRDRVFVGARILFVIIAFVSVVALFRTGNEGFLGRTDRAEGAFGKATGAGGFAATAIPIVLWWIRYSRGTTRCVAQGILCLQAYLLFFSGARGALLASCIGLGVLGFLMYPKARIPIIGVLVLAVALAATGVVGLDMLPDYVVRKESIATGAGRFTRANALLKAWEKQPITGYGYGTGRFMIVRDADALADYLGDDTTSNSSRYLITAHKAGRLVEIQPHNDHVERLVETGLLGYICFAIMWLTIFLRIPQVMRRKRSPVNDLTIALSASTWFYFVNTMLHSGMFAVGSGSIVVSWFTIMLLLAADTVARRDGSTFRRRHVLNRPAITPSAATNAFGATDAGGPAEPALSSTS